MYAYTLFDLLVPGTNNVVVPAGTPVEILSHTTDGMFIIDAGMKKLCRIKMAYVVSFDSPLKVDA